MGNIDEQLQAIREELEKIHKKVGFEGLPTLLTMERAAYELSRSPTTLKAMIKRRELMTVMILKTRMVPASEIRRLASSDEKRSEAPKPVRSSLQDPEALKRRR